MWWCVGEKTYIFALFNLISRNSDHEYDFSQFVLHICYNENSNPHWPFYFSILRYLFGKEFAAISHYAPQTDNFLLNQILLRISEYRILNIICISVYHPKSERFMKLAVKVNIACLLNAQSSDIRLPKARREKQIRPTILLLFYSIIIYFCLYMVTVHIIYEY